MNTNAMPINNSLSAYPLLYTFLACFELSKMKMKPINPSAMKKLAINPSKTSCLFNVPMYINVKPPVLTFCPKGINQDFPMFDIVNTPPPSKNKHPIINTTLRKPRDGLGGAFNLGFVNLIFGFLMKGNIHRI